MSKLTVALVVVIAVLGGFYGGFHYQVNRVTAAGTSSGATSTSAPAATGRTAGGLPSVGAGTAGSGGFGGGSGRGGNLGTVTNLTSTGFTLHTANGSDVSVILGSQASVRKTVDAQSSDLQNNLQVTVAGQRDASGSITATTVTIVPAAVTPGG